MAGTYHLRIDQGSDYALQLTYQDAEGESIDVSSHTAALQIRTTHEDADTLLELDHSNGITLAANGEILIEITAAQTESLPTSVRNPVGVWDIELTGGGLVKRLLGGKVYVSPEVTRD